METMTNLVAMNITADRLWSLNVILTNMNEASLEKKQISVFGQEIHIYFVIPKRRKLPRKRGHVKKT